MFFGDKGSAEQVNTQRRNYFLIIDNEKETIRKLINHLGFYSVIFEKNIKEQEIVYDTDKNLFTGVGILLRKKITPKRAYFSLVRINSLNTSTQAREKKYFLGECDKKDNPSDFPTQIAEQLNQIFNNLFTVNVMHIVKHAPPYISTTITGHKYKVISGTGYVMKFEFQNLSVVNLRTGVKAKTRIASVDVDDNPKYEEERKHLFWVIERYCKELAFVNKNRFEIVENLVKPKVDPKAQQQANKKQKKGKEKIDKSQARF